MPKERQNTSVARILLGSVVFYLIFIIIEFLIFWAYAYALANGAVMALPNSILTAVISLLLILYMYGFLGLWLHEMGAGANGSGGSRNPILRVLGSILGFIGFFLRPFPIMAYGANKKKYLYFTVAIPLAALAVAAIVLGAIGYRIPVDIQGSWSAFFYLSAANALLNVLCLFTIKKCPNCKCVMSKFDYDYVSLKEQAYTKQRSERVGTIDFGEYGTAGVYENYNVQHVGTRVTYAKTYECLHCGTKRQGRTHSFNERASDDFS